jgi:hypothetical protein
MLSKDMFEDVEESQVPRSCAVNTTLTPGVKILQALRARFSSKITSFEW